MDQERLDAGTKATSETLVKRRKRGIWDGGVSPFKSSYGKLMMWFFLLSDAFTFSALLISYGMVRYYHTAFEGPIREFHFSPDHWPVPEMVFADVPFFPDLHAPLFFVTLMTFILIASSVTMVLAVEAGSRMDKKNVQKWLLWTIAGGVVFLLCQAWEWAHFIVGPEGGSGMASLVSNPYGPPLFAAFFFFITGFHGTHVLSGVVLNSYVFYNTVVGKYQEKGSYEMVEKTGLYWHFVDLVWVFVFTLFYLI
jgi:cytochrome c oxidase subunit III